MGLNDGAHCLHNAETEVRNPSSMSSPAKGLKGPMKIYVPNCHRNTLSTILLKLSCVAGTCKNESKIHGMEHFSTSSCLGLPGILLVLAFWTAITSIAMLLTPQKGTESLRYPIHPKRADFETTVMLLHCYHKFFTPYS